MASAAHAEVVQRIMVAASHYEVLGGEVSKHSSDDDVRRAYKTLALRTHPDKNSHEHAVEAFKRVQNAFKALETQEKRSEYHRTCNSCGLSFGDHDAGGGGEDEVDEDLREFFHSAFGAGFGFGVNGRGYGPRGGLSPEDFIMEMFMREMVFERQSSPFGFGGPAFGGFHQHTREPFGTFYEYDDDPEFEFYEEDDDPFDYYYEQEDDDEEDSDDGSDEDDESDGSMSLPEGYKHISVTWYGESRCNPCGVAGDHVNRPEHRTSAQHVAAMDRLRQTGVFPVVHDAPTPMKPLYLGNRLRYPGRRYGEE